MATRRVTIARGADNSFGFSLGQMSKSHVVSRVNPMLSDRLKTGEKIVSIDGKSIESLSHSQVVEFIKNSERQQLELGLASGRTSPAGGGPQHSPGARAALPSLEKLPALGSVKYSPDQSHADSSTHTFQANGRLAVNQAPRPDQPEYWKRIARISKTPEVKSKTHGYIMDVGQMVYEGRDAEYMRMREMAVKRAVEQEKAKHRKHLDHCLKEAAVKAQKELNEAIRMAEAAAEAEAVRVSRARDEQQKQAVAKAREEEIAIKVEELRVARAQADLRQEKAVAQSIKETQVYEREQAAKRQREALELAAGKARVHCDASVAEAVEQKRGEMQAQIDEMKRIFEAKFARSTAQHDDEASALDALQKELEEAKATNAKCEARYRQLMRTHQRVLGCSLKNYDGADAPQDGAHGAPATASSAWLS